MINFKRKILPATEDGWNDLVVTWKKDGTPKSLFTHNFWDAEDDRVSRTDPRGFNFERVRDTSGASDLMLNECKKLFYLMWRTHAKNGDLPKVTTASSYLVFLNYLISKISGTESSLFEFLSSPKKIREYASSLSDGWTVKCLYTLMQRIREFKIKLPGLEPAFQVIPYLKRLKKELPAETLQHPVIPTRIFLTMIINYQDVISEYLAKRSNLENFISRASSERNFARGDWSRRRAERASGSPLELIPFAKAVDEYGLTEIVAKYKLLNMNHFTRYMTLVQYCCKMMIHIFSGMRNSEAYSIDLGGYEARHESYGKVCSLIGVTTKLLTGTASFTERWITSPEVEPAMRAASSIAGIVYRFNDCVGGKALFVSSAYLPFARNLYDWPSAGTAEEIALASLEPSRYESQLPEILITEDDRRELEMTDFSRDWSAQKKFDIGKKWPLSVHQIRRSLCVYAARSELVTLPSLKMLMKHITSQMTLYYMKGFALSEDLINPSRHHVMHDVLREAPYAESILYAKEILMSEEKLWGSGGKYLNNSHFIDGVNVVESWETTQKQFKAGQLSYRGTMTGGCMSSAVCHKRGFVDPLGCVGCSEGVLISWKVERAYNMQLEYVESLDVNTVEYRTQAETLSSLERLLSSVKKKND
ncbi:hypothetical protein BW687_006300 [Pseudomonas graminis]|uniref:hypothetical protein n=1 Tax=Pseudomonas graminis TaxID=158627 RepID=UPI00234A78A4|nr:hypothetical protein [Pseudomonas graminis]MDC6379791.1 hypothetical protein [Pseudomonas graminis]